MSFILIVQRNSPVLADMLAARIYVHICIYIYIYIYVYVFSTRVYTLIY